MTTFDRDPLFDPRISDWLEADPDHAPEIVLETITAALPSIPQRRAWRAPWRFQLMPMPARVAAAAIIGVLLVGGAVYMFSPGGRSGVGPPAPSPVTASPATASSPQPSSAFASDVVPQEMWGDWQSPAGQSIAGLYDASEYIQLTIDPNDTRHLWIETLHGGRGFMSTVHQESADEIKLVTPTPGADQGVGASCTEGQVGHYRWSKSTNGLSLTLTAIDDQCADRISTLSRTWTH